MVRFAAFAALVLAGCHDLEHPSYDLVIRGGTIIDGTGSPGVRGDVAIRGDQIAAVGVVPGTGRREINASGLAVAPGFIDMHSHSDYLLLEDGNAQSKIRQGVTTEVLGEGDSVAPAKGALKGTHPWTTLGGYFEALEKRGVSVNVASYVAQGTVWKCVLGESPRRPTEEELDLMAALVGEAMEEGAFGLSTMLAAEAGFRATTDDLVHLAHAVHLYGGLYSSHIRNEGLGVFDAIREAISVGERAVVPVDIIHLKIADQKNWGRMNEIVALIEDARRRGVNVQANIYPYTRGNNDLHSILPPWAREDGREKTAARLRDPALRERMKKDIREGIPGWYDHYTAVGGDWSRMLVNGELSAKNKPFIGQTMDKILAAKNPAADPLDVLFDFLLEENLSIPTIFAHHTEEDMMLALSQPWCSIGSDGLAHATEGPTRTGQPHPRSFGTFPRVLGVYVREKKLLTLEEAVRKMTSLSATKLGLADRGVLQAGAFADVVLFDPARVSDRATYLDPWQYPVGIEMVIVNGTVVIEKGTHTGARPGRALRHGR
jgi:N-acyl-D-aspartate/D-glutamate deacylase